MRRLLLIARREYTAYTRTVGFWLTLLIVPGFGLLGGVLPGLIKDATPVRAIALADFTGRGEDQALTRAFADLNREAEIKELGSAARLEAGEQGADRVREAARAGGPAAGLALLKTLAPRAATSWKPPRPPVRIVAVPTEVAAAKDADAGEAAARRFIASEPEKAAPIDDIVVLRLQGDTPVARLWSVRVSDGEASQAVKDGLGRVMRRERLATVGVAPAMLDSLDATEADVRLFSPRAASGGAVSLRDRLPQVIGFGVGFLLWSLVLTAAGILMNSVMEEKSNRVLEVLLSSADASEILTGKVLGVAAIALTVIGVWAGLGFTLLSRQLPGAFDLIAPALNDIPFWILCAIYFLAGYLMYGIVFAAIGAFCETPRDAQTLLGPLMMVLVVPLVVMEIAVRAPELPLLRILSWVPLFTPFLMPARLPTHPPILEIAASLVGMALMAALMIWVGAKAFRTGALSTGRIDLRSLLGLGRKGAGG